MNNKKVLPPDFHGEKYGLTFRLIDEKDASFIIELRTAPQVGAFLHKTSSNIEDQKQWIAAYKKREEVGTDYYFIFFKDGEPIGLDRIYDINGTTFNVGSWVMKQGIPVEHVLAVPIITNEIAFDILHLELNDSPDGVHEDNKKVLKFNKMLGYKITGEYQCENGRFFSIRLTKHDFEAKKACLIKFLNNDGNE